MKLACVIHRFGADIAGGSEAHCRAVALHLARSHDVTVLSSCARDHVTWQNHYPPGETTDGPLRVRRFPVAERRDLARFRDISRLVFSGRGSEADQEAWFRENGPLVPALLDELRSHGRDYDRLLFWSYRYYPTYFGLPIVASRAVLLPTAEEDPLIRAAALERLFAAPAGYLFLTPEEETLVTERAPVRVPSAVVGCGIDPAEMGSGFFSRGAPVTGSEGARKPGSGVFSEWAPAGRFAQEIGLKMTPDVVSGSADARPPKKNPDPVSDAASSALPKKNPDPVLARIPDPFILYLGRVDPNKGCETLLHYFTRYAAGGRTVTLVLAGPVNMPVPDHPSIRTLGFVDDDVREALLSRARVLVMPSPYESLSMVLLEAWNHAVPALVNARCAVLYGQVRRADGGLHYRTGGEFAAALDYLLDRPDAARTLGAQGLAYVDREYRWPTVLAKIEDVLARTGTR